MTKAYKFDPHTHTAESSLCSLLSANEMVDMYHAAGFGGIAVTDHIHEYFVSKCGDWDACVDRLLSGYKNAKSRGDELGLDVILGVEIRFNNVYGDFLVYGMDEKFLRQNPYIHRLNPQEFFKCHGDELLIIQAHPYRGEDSPKLDCVHGLEVYNDNPRHVNNNDKTVALCASRPELYTTSASDTHQAGDVGTGWMEFNQPVVDAWQFRDLVRGREYLLGNAPRE